MNNSSFLPHRATLVPDGGATETGILAPIAALPHGTILPSAYIIHKFAQGCNNCSTKHEWSEVYAYNQLRTRTGAGKYITNLVRVYGFDYNIPVHVMPVAEHRVPACFECGPSIDLSHLPKLQETPVWQEAVARKRAAEDAAKPPKDRSTSASPPPTTEALLDLI